MRFDIVQASALSTHVPVLSARASEASIRTDHFSRVMNHDHRVFTIPPPVEAACNSLRELQLKITSRISRILSLAVIVHALPEEMVKAPH
jgi:hypothetical protein